MKACTVALLVAPALWFSVAQAAEQARPNINEELSRQQSIYRGDGDKPVEGYTVDRALNLYADALPSAFRTELAKLGPEDRWLDIGAGQGQAILDYYSDDYDREHRRDGRRTGKKAQAIAISIEDRRTPFWKKKAGDLGVNRIQYFSGDRLREYTLEELGNFEIITDVIGGFSYTDDLSLFMEKVMGFLEVGGSFFGVLQDVQWQDGSLKPYYQGSPFLTELVDRDGKELKICSWLKRITCAEVTCESRVHWQPPMEAYQVKKTCDDVSVPALTPVHYQAGTPPERRFRLK